MAFEKKTWKNRIAEYINRRTLTLVETPASMESGGTLLVDVARQEGTISEEGNAFNEDEMNDLEERIAAEFASQNETLTNLNTNLNEKTTWKHLGYVTGTEEVTLPDEFEELYITVNTNRVKNDTVWADLFTCLIPNAILSDTSKQFVFSSSSGTGSTDFTVQARVNKNVAKLETCRTGTTNYSSTATFDICYR